MTTVAPDARRIWHATRGPAAILLMIIAAGIVIALVRGSGSGSSLDPESVDPSGSRALARLLGAQGVRVTPVHTLAAAESALDGPATLLVTRPEQVVPQRIADLARSAADLVLISPPADTLRALHVRARVTGQIDVTDRPAGCVLDPARVAGTATMGGDRYAGVPGLCYAGSLARAANITLLGTGVPLTNDKLDEQGNAALAMRLLGQHERLVWYVPSPSDPTARPEERTLLDLLPAGWVFGAIQLAIAVVVVALWRARRLGPVVTEPLPVVVRAAETVEGRARLYRRAGAADHAAETLRQAARDRLVPRLGLPRDATAEAVTEAVSAGTGRPAAAVHDLLCGPAPAGDAALVRLADELDALESAT